MKGQDTLSIESNKNLKVTFDDAFDIKKVTQGTHTAPVSLANFEEFDFDTEKNVHLSAKDPLRISSGSMIDIGTGDGKDTISFGTVTISNTNSKRDTHLTLDTSDGKDSIAIDKLKMTGSSYVSIDAGGDNDNIAIDSISGKNAVIHLDGEKGKDIRFPPNFVNFLVALPLSPHTIRQPYFVAIMG